MTDHPMLFSAPMVRALLEGRKTQTRRVVEPIYILPSPPVMDLWEVARGGPYFRLKAHAGDRFWARESLKRGANNEVVYAADGHVHPDAEWVWQRNTMPSIYMPRGLSRLTLNVEDVKVEQLQDISEADAIAEGVEQDSEGWLDYLMPETQRASSAKNSFSTLWNSINGDRPGRAWADNPWVVAYRSNVIRDNISRIKP